MFNLLMAPMDVELTIEKIKGENINLNNSHEKFSSNGRRHLGNLGFVPGAKISIINQIDGNVIVKVKDSKIAIDKSIAKKIIVRN
ncbi:MAG: FeoA family protein [Peptoniphilaceae bacterium]|nr:FeoA family protein [Peptoniphilaceae bacterium]MDY6019035.1 FeoA family protein [Anaerococcus sp.]